ncbi:hypothetical protein D3C87_323670 [compost metagenome]
MKIYQANTYDYEMKHFGRLLKQDRGEEASCFKNVKQFCRDYIKEGRDVSVSLVVGLRGWCDQAGSTLSYHYLVKDNETGEFTDPQYWRFTFIELHNWSLKDYEKECNEFQEIYDKHPKQEFFKWYCDFGFLHIIEHSLKLIKSFSSGQRLRLSNKRIEEYCRDDDCDYEIPKYGKGMIPLLDLD